MKKITLIGLAALTISTMAFADDWCKLGEPCPIANEILLSSPYVGTYRCAFSAGDMEDIQVQLTLMTKNTIAEPASLILSKGPNSNDRNSGELIIKKNPLGKDGASLKNAISISPPLRPVGCDLTKPNTCDVPRTVTCMRVGD